MSNATRSSDGAKGPAAFRERAPRPRTIAPDFDIASAACAAETRRFAAFHANPSVLERMAQLDGAREASLVQGRIGLMQHGYRVDPTITPKLARLAESLRKTLRLVQPLDVFVQPDPESNAYCLPSRKGNRLVMGLFSGLVSALNERELLFVMGHELGHALLRHGETVRFDFGHPLFSFLETHQVRGLARAREISCDRIGLLGCQDLRVATTAMFKVASGLNDRWIVFDETDYARHFDQLSELNELVELDQTGSTHPPMPLRVKALMSFSRSEFYAKAIGASTWELTTGELEREVDAMLAVVDPDLSEMEGADEQRAANEFIRAGALLVVAADGVVSPEEIAWLNRNTDGAHTAESMQAALADGTFLERTREDVQRSAQVLRHKLPEVLRGGILRTMCEVAASAGGIIDAEMRVLNELRNTLEVSLDIAREHLSAAHEAAGAQAKADGDAGAG
jgi:uncharacterized tellurite resistance protein B-like protein